MHKGQLEVSDFFNRESYTYKSFANGRWRPGMIGGTLHSQNMTITAAGAAGKTSLLRILRNKYTHSTCVSGGDFMRKKAAELGIGIEEFAKRAALDPEGKVDRECDEYLCRSVMGKRLVIMESRISHCIDPDAFHVLLTCPRHIRAARRRNDLLHAGQSVPLEHVLRDLVRRDRIDEKRLELLYSGYMWPREDFDLVIDTSGESERGVMNRVIDAYEQWCKRVLLWQFEGRGNLPLSVA